ncbi:MAG: SHOCT domain-containing protein [Candidatus Moraniibacteriota bacterium]
MMGNYFGGGYGYMGGFGFLFMIFCFGLIIWAIVAGVRMMSHGGNHSCCGNSKEDDATKILSTRYAKGEITKEQFDQMKKDLNS